MEFTREIVQALGAAFPEEEVDFLPRGNANGKARALAYIDARSVMGRLDAVVGPGNWSFDFDVLSPDGKMVRGKLSVLGVTKCDAGEGDTEDEVLKSAVSDALKRAAVHFGIGRYLYHLPAIWAPFDSQKRRFTEPPRLDPRAVERALAICGVSSKPERQRPASSGASGAAEGNRAPAAAPSAAPSMDPPQAPIQTPRASVQAREERGEDAEGRKSIWAAGAPGERAESASGVREPESSGDRAATRPAPRGTAASTAPTATAVAEGGALVCSGTDCGKALTKGQHDVSLRAFGQPLCPACQKGRARAGA